MNKKVMTFKESKDMLWEGLKGRKWRENDVIKLGPQNIKCKI